MTKRFFILMTMGLMMSAGVMAQGFISRYHDVELNEAQGNVKSITLRDLAGKVKRIEFTEEGQEKNLKDPVYDSNGYLQSHKRNMFGFTFVANYTWEYDRVTKISGNVMNMPAEIEYVYDAAGELTSNIVNLQGHRTEGMYSDYEYDERGNWTKRNYSLAGKEFTETRTIEYY
jgi:hypothetical protein